MIADDRLPDAIEINDTGAVQDWSGVADIAGSVYLQKPGPRQGCRGAGGHRYRRKLRIHVDHEAWRVTNTYNCDAAIIGKHVFIHRRIERISTTSTVAVPGAWPAAARRRAA